MTEGMSCQEYRDHTKREYLSPTPPLENRYYSNKELDSFDKNYVPDEKLAMHVGNCSSCGDWDRKRDEIKRRVAED